MSCQHCSPTASPGGEHHGRPDRRPPTRREGGYATPVLVLLAVALMALAGLAIDGGRAIAARQRAANIAEQAARAGADQLDVSAYRARGVGDVAPGPARAAACGYVARAYPGAGCRARVTGDSITVRVTTTTRTAILGIVGIHTLRVGGRATSEAVRGITRGREV